MRRGMLPALLVLVGVAVVGAASRAQKKPPVAAVPAPRATPTPTPRADVARHRPALLAQVSPDKPSQPLGLARMSVEVTITGFLARTSTTLTFRNDTGRVLEGELVFPLPEGATVSGYALDVSGQLVDGVVVEREAARVAFESEVRRGVDPGLVEWVRGNNFRTRVYPIPAHGTRTARIEYVSDLVTEGHGEALDAVYFLPLKQAEPVAEFELKVEVKKGGPAPEVRAGALSNFRFAAFEDRYVAQTRLVAARLREDLRVALPHFPRENAVVELGADGGAYFAIHDFPGLPAAPAARVRPQRVGLLWDASLSHGRADRRREIELVRRWLAGLGDVELVLTAFRNVPEAPRRFSVKGGDTSAVLRALDEMPYDGGTALGRVAPEAGVAYSLLVSDGLATLGQVEPRAARGPIYTLSADPAADHGLLRHLAAAGGGMHFNLGVVTDDAVLAALGLPAWKATVEYEPGSAAEVLPSGAQPVQSERVTIVGRLVGQEARVRLRYALAGGGTRERAYVVTRKAAGPGALVPRFWAQHKLRELQLAPERHRAELLALGRKFGIVTPGTSLLVLETVDQYVRHEVEPPASQPALRDEYRRRIAAREEVQGVKQRDKLETVVRSWEERVRFWETEFHPQAVLAKQAGRRYGDELSRERDDARAVAGSGRVAEDVQPLPTGAPPPPPPAAMADAMRAEPSRQSMRAAAAPAGPAGRAKSEREAGTGAAGAAIAVKPWDPETPYLNAMKDAGPQRAYAVYLRQREAHGASPAFYLDCADHLLRAGQRELGLRVLTSLLELKLDDARLLRVAAHRLQQAAELDLAIELFERVLRERPEEPQSPRDLALAFAARGDARRAERKLAADDYLRALDLLDHVVRHDWDARFPEIETIVLMDANRILALFEREPLPGKERIRIDPRLRRLLDVDVRIVLTWDSDQSDMDLWVTEPTGEKCLYSHNRTAAGGRLSHDFTGGYGPEEYVLRRGLSGEYLVQANYYGTREQSLTGPTTVQATVITGFGRPDEKREALTLRLAGRRDVVEIGRVTLAGTAKVTP